MFNRQPPSWLRRGAIFYVVISVYIGLLKYILKLSIGERKKPHFASSPSMDARKKSGQRPKPKVSSQTYSRSLTSCPTQAVYRAREQVGSAPAREQAGPTRGQPGPAAPIGQQASAQLPHLLHHHRQMPQALPRFLRQSRRSPPRLLHQSRQPPPRLLYQGRVSPRAMPRFPPMSRWILLVVPHVAEVALGMGRMIASLYVMAWLRNVV
jgi:hypothetical protein